ncbi:hypothetical protein MMC30_005062 [Trapelia coarctata]|nr:hypothetical protein [Trapelia coarctata]
MSVVVLHASRCWLIDLARQVDPSWKLEGFDISDLQYPVKEYLPENVSLGILDIFGDIPEDLVGKFDIVHIRAFVLVVKCGNPGPLIENLNKLLKPGGYLQWDEWDGATIKVHTPTSRVDKGATEFIFSQWRIMVKDAPFNLDFTYQSHLADHLRKHQFDVLDSFRKPVRNDDRKAWTDDWMMALDEAGSNVLARHGARSLLGTAGQFQEMFDRALAETQKGVSIEVEMIGAVGRKY